MKTRRTARSERSGLDVHEHREYGTTQYSQRATNNKPDRTRHLRVVRLSDQAYTVDALAVRGDEGRANLRKAPVR